MWMLVEARIEGGAGGGEAKTGTTRARCCVAVPPVLTGLVDVIGVPLASFYYQVICASIAAKGLPTVRKGEECYPVQCESRDDLMPCIPPPSLGLQCPDERVQGQRD